jgi:CheY-like chemotaxis protein
MRIVEPTPIHNVNNHGMPGWVVTFDRIVRHGPERTREKKENEMVGQILEGKRILVVDNEREVLGMVAEALATSEVVTVGNVDEARPLIATESFDLAILDTVGANGCDLLKDCHANKLPAAMLTTRRIEVTTLNLALKRGAMSFFPKDELKLLPETVAELLERVEKGKTYWAKLFRFFGSVFKETWRVMDEDTARDLKLPRVYW